MTEQLAKPGNPIRSGTMTESFIKLHCFIDYENVHESGFEGVETLSDGDAITIFISSPSHKISLVILETLLRKKCELTIIHTIGTGKNNLDFQLVAELGYQIGQHPVGERAFAIISKDRGYENVVSAFANRGIIIEMCETVEKIRHIRRTEDVTTEKTKVEDDWGFSIEIQHSVSGLKLSPADVLRVERIFRESTTLAMLHDRLAKAYGKKGNLQLYSKLKMLHKKYQKTLPEPENRPEEMLEDARFEAESMNQLIKNLQSPSDLAHSEPNGQEEGDNLKAQPVIADASSETRIPKRGRKSRNGSKKTNVEKSQSQQPVEAIQNADAENQSAADVSESPKPELVSESTNGGHFENSPSENSIHKEAPKKARGRRKKPESKNTGELPPRVNMNTEANQTDNINNAVKSDTTVHEKKTSRRPGRPRKHAKPEDSLEKARETDQNQKHEPSERDKNQH
jgi:hypothetical protein